MEPSTTKPAVRVHWAVSILVFVLAFPVAASVMFHSLLAVQLGFDAGQYFRGIGRLSMTLYSHMVMWGGQGQMLLASYALSGVLYVLLAGVVFRVRPVGAQTRFTAGIFGAICGVVATALAWEFLLLLFGTPRLQWLPVEVLPAGALLGALLSALGWRRPR